jgi:sulfatase modifying factor 1
MGRGSHTSVMLVAAAVACVAACSHSDALQGAEGPAPPRSDPPPAAVASGTETPAVESSVGQAEPVFAAGTGIAASTGETAPRGIPSVDTCPDAMVLVDGDRCTAVRQECVEWLDPRGTPRARCARFAPSVCTGKKVHERFCIDRDEYVAPGQELPEGGSSWTEARATCERDGKRLCRETEWELACEGEQALPYPTGYARDAKACNFDKGDLVDPETGKLRDQREPPSSLDRCVSPFGVRSMTGNVDEWVWRDHTSGTWRSALKGGWWMAARERCRPATTSHDEHYRELQTGFRCCSDSAG